MVAIPDDRDAEAVAERLAERVEDRGHVLARRLDEGRHAGREVHAEHEVETRESVHGIHFGVLDAAGEWRRDVNMVLP